MIERTSDGGVAVEASGKVSTTFRNLTTEMPIIGFTGPLASGCTYFAKALADKHHYVYCQLSKPIRDLADKAGIDPTPGKLQHIGNRMRERLGLDCLVNITLAEVDSQIPEPDKPGRPVGVVVDGIRNTAEVEALRQWAGFYLVSVHAPEQLREQRGLTSGKFKTKEEFGEANARDAEEYTIAGQQVRRCSDLSDIIVVNEKHVPPDSVLNYQRYVDEALYDRYVRLIEQLVQGETPLDCRPDQQETLMTAAYVESRRSFCLKRKVGAVIADKDGRVLTAGHNDVPEGSKPCIEENGCRRDRIQEESAQKIRHCPNCGTEITLAAKCVWCEADLNRFLKRCPNPNCKKDPEVTYTCPKCKMDVFREFVVGAQAEKTGKLLDVCRSVHAEENAILNLSRMGVRLPEGAVLYSTTYPCDLCARKIAAIGVKKVVYAEPYVMAEAEKVFAEQGVDSVKFQGVKSRAYFRLYAS